MNRARLLRALALCVGAVLLCGGGLAASETEAVAAADAVSLLAASPSPEWPMLLGEGEDAAATIEALRPAAETDVNAALRLAWLLHVYANDNAAAKPLFERVVEANPASVWARFGLASIAWLEGDAATLSTQMAAVVEHNHTHPLVELALHELRALWGSAPEARTGTRALLGAFLDDPAVTNPEAIGLAFGLLWHHLEWHGLTDERDALLETAGAVRSWRFAGPFEPLDDLLFFAPLAPDDEPFLAPSYMIEGEEERTRRHDTRELDIEPMWVYSGVWYAETFIRPETPGRALLRVVSNDSVRVELNGGTVYLKDTFHTFAPDTETVEIELPPGWSRLRVKYQAPDTIIVRLLDLRARPLALEVDPSPRSVEQSPAAPGRVVATACEAYLDRLARTDPDNPLVHALAAELAHRRENTEAAKIAALRCLELHEDWATGQLVAGTVLADDPTQPERIARSRAKAHYKRAIKLAGTCPPALYALALYEQQEQRLKEAIEKLEQCVEQAPHNVLWWRALYDVYTERKWAKEREAALEAMVELNPDAPSVVDAARDYYNERNLFDRVRTAEMRLHAGNPGSTYLAGILERTGKLDEAMAEYARLAAEYPGVTYYRHSLVRLDRMVGRFDAAARELRALLADDPRDTDLIKELAEVELQRGRLGEAIRLWRRALAEEPADLEVRKALALHGMDEVFDRYAIDVAPYLADASLREKYATYASVLVVDYAIEQVFANGSGRQLTHQLVLVNTKAGIEEWGEVEAPWGGELLELRVIKPDGTVVEPELVPGKYTISLTGLAEGDFIEIKYIESNRAWGAPSFLGPSFVFCSDTEPMHLTRYLVMAPVSLDLKIEQLNMDVEPTEWTRDGWRFWQWERHEVEPIRPEPSSVDPDEYMPWVRVGFGQRVGYQRCDFEDDNVGMTTPNLEVRRTVEELIEPGMSREDILRTLHTWVNTNIDGGGSGPGLNETASQTLGARRGNRMALLKAMLDVAGIRSHIVMVRPVTAFDSAVFPNSFSYGLLRVEGSDGGPDWWIDLNNKFYPLGFVHPRVQGGRAVVLRDVEPSVPGGGVAYDPNETAAETRVPVRPETHMTQHVEVDLHVDENGGLEAQLTVTLTGLAAASLRGGLERVDEDQLERFLQMVASNYFRGAKLGDYAIEHRKAFDEPLVARGTLTAPKYARKRGRSLRFNQPLFALNLRKSYTRVPERKTPMALFALPSSRYTITITLPEGTTLRQGLEPLALETRFGSYRYSFEFDEAASRATIEREFTLPIQRVQPADYADFVAFCRAIDEHEEDELKVLLPETADVEEEAIEDDGGVDDEGVDDEGVEDDGVEDDGVEDDGVEDDGLEDEARADEPSDALLPVGVPG